MATSQTKTFNPNVEEILEEAFERAGVELRSGNDFRTGRRSMEYLLLEWQNKGINLWMIEEGSIASSTIADGTLSYDLDQDVVDLLDVWIREDAGTADQTDYYLEPMSPNSYARISNKLTEGRPTRYYFERKGIRDHSAAGADQAPVIKLWPVPDETNKYTLVFNKMTRIDDVGDSALNTLEIPARFLPAMVAGLAQRIAAKQPAPDPNRIAGLAQEYAYLLEEAMEEDRVKSDFFINPDVSGYSD